MTNQQSKTNQISELILKTISAEKPETTEQLIKLVQAKTVLPGEEITRLIIELEKKDKIHFNKKETPPTTSTAYILSSKSTWYWITITLATATALAVFTIPEDAYPIVYARSALGIIFVLFLPGYTFIRMLFPQKLPIATSSDDMDAIERVALSFGISLALTPIVGLILNYTPWGIRLTPVTLSLLALTGVFATAAILREYQTKTK